MKHLFSVARLVVSGTGSRGARRIGSGAALALFLLSLSTAGQNYRLSDPLPAGRAVNSFQITPDGSRAVYLANPVVSQFYELFSVSTNGAQAPVTISTTPAIGTIQTFRVSPDGQRVAFVGDTEEDGVGHLYAAPVDGSAGPVRLDGILVSGGDVSAYQFQFTPDGGRVIYLADSGMDERFELHTVPADGSSPPSVLGGPLVAGGDVLGGFAVSPDGNRVAYVADQDANDVFELYSVPADGSSASVKLSGTMVFGGDVSFGPLIGPDGTRVLSLADQNVNGVVELFSVPIDASQAPVKLNNPVTEGVTGESKIDPTGERVFFLVKEGWGRNLHAARVAGGQPAIRVNGSPHHFKSGEFVYSFLPTPDGRSVLYITISNLPVRELYATCFDVRRLPARQP